MKSRRNVKVLVVLAFLLNNAFCSHNECGKIKSKDNAFPWNVGIYIEGRNNLELICFGSIIEANAVLSAAHCFYDNLNNRMRNNSFYIATGSLQKTINAKSIPANVKKILNTDIIAEKHYNGLISLLSHDIAIIKIKFEINDSIRPVCLDWTSTVRESKSEGKQSIWGKNKVSSTDVNFLNAEDCSYETPEDFLRYIISDKDCTQIKDSGNQLSHESEGSGVVFFHSNRWYIKGVTSMHNVKGGKISTYTPINQYLNWLSNTYSVF